MGDKIYWHALNSVPGIGPQKFMQLVEYFKSPELALKAPSAQLERVLGKQTRTLSNLLNYRDLLNVEKEYEILCEKSIKILTSDDPNYPLSLRYIYSYPPVLYYRGSLQPTDQNAIAIVGSRKGTVYGKKMAESLGYNLAKNGVTVVSGMARGIDTHAHRGALKALGRTIAILGCGLDIVYPRENKKLMDEIIEAGAVMSEFPPSTKPDASNFPRRNRIISGLSLGVVVVEAAEKSGSLITADLALEQGKDVFAVPGPAGGAYSKGTNQLIKQGAKLIENANDVLEEFGVECPSEIRKEKPSLSALEAQIVNLLSWEPVCFDNLHESLGVQAEELLSELSMLEIKGLIKQVSGQKYILIS